MAAEGSPTSVRKSLQEILNPSFWSFLPLNGPGNKTTALLKSLPDFNSPESEDVKVTFSHHLTQLSLENQKKLTQLFREATAEDHLETNAFRWARFVSLEVSKWEDGARQISTEPQDIAERYEAYKKERPTEAEWNRDLKGFFWIPKQSSELKSYLDGCLEKYPSEMHLSINEFMQLMEKSWEDLQKRLRKEKGEIEEKIQKNPSMKQAAGFLSRKEGFCMIDHMITKHALSKRPDILPTLLKNPRRMHFGGELGSTHSYTQEEIELLSVPLAGRDFPHHKTGKLI